MILSSAGRPQLTDQAKDTNLNSTLSSPELVYRPCSSIGYSHVIPGEASAQMPRLTPQPADKAHDMTPPGSTSRGHREAPLHSRLFRLVKRLGNSAPASESPSPPVARRWSRRVAIEATLAGLVWSVIVLVALLVAWGGPSRTSFQSPDEALTQMAIQQVAETGSPIQTPPFDDPEGLAHARLWVTVNGSNLPTHPPVLFFLYGSIQRLIPGGEWIVFLVPALGLGSLVAAAYSLLPRHRWVALLLPGLMFPATYRMLRPWSNIAAMLGLIGFSALAWASWRRSLRPGFLYAALGFVVLAAAVRPDQVHLIIGLSLAATLSVVPLGNWGWTLALHTVAGIMVVSMVLIGNQVVTGELLTAPVDFLKTAPGTELAGRSLPSPFRELAVILLPKGIPDSSEVYTQTVKYWWDLGPMALVTISASLAVVLGTIRGLATRRFRQLALIALGATLVLTFFITRINATDFGASDPLPGIRYSLPRYSALAYVTLAVMALMLTNFATRRQRRTFVSMVLMIPILVAGLWGLRYIYDGEPTQSFSWFADQRQMLEGYPAAIDEGLSEDGILYVRFRDKYVWGARPVALIPTEPGPQKAFIDFDSLSNSLAGAMAAGLSPYVFELGEDEVTKLTAAFPDGTVEITAGVVGGWEVWSIKDVRE